MLSSPLASPSSYLSASITRVVSTLATAAYRDSCVECAATLLASSPLASLSQHKATRYAIPFAASPQRPPSRARSSGCEFVAYLSAWWRAAALFRARLLSLSFSLSCSPCTRRLVLIVVVCCEALRPAPASASFLLSLVHLALVVTSTAPGPPPPPPLLASPHYSGRLPKPICLVRFVRFVRFVRSFAPLPDPLAPRHHEPHHAYLHPGEVRQRLLPTQQPPPPAASHASLIVVLLAMMLQPQQPVART